MFYLASIFLMEMERGIAEITGPDDWEKATLHLWGRTRAELNRLFHTVLLDSPTLQVQAVDLGEHIRRIVINPPIQRVSVTF